MHTTLRRLHNPYRRFLFIVVLASSLHRANAQVIISLLFGDQLNSERLIFGLHTNYGLNNLSGIEPQEKLGKLNLSLFFNFGIHDKWRINIEALAKATRGGDGITPYRLHDSTLDQHFSGGKVERSINYVGLLGSIQFIVKQSWYLEAGPQLTIRTKAKDVFSAGSSDGELELTRDIRDDISRWDFSALAGLGFRFGKGTGMTLGFRYNWGLSDVMKNLAGSQQNRGIFIVSNIPIGRNKKEK